MGRALLSLRVTDQAGNVAAGVLVDVLEADGVTALAQPLYAAPTGSQRSTNPLRTDRYGSVIAYAEIPQRAAASVVGVGLVMPVDIADDPADMGSGGGGGPIADGSITTAMLAPAAVTTDKLAPGAVTTDKLANGTILDEDIAAAAGIALSKLAAGTAGVLKSNGTVITSGNTISSSDITDGTIVNTDINTTAGITVSKLAAGGTANRVVLTTDGAALTLGQVTSTMIADGTIVGADIADNTISAAKLNFDPTGGSGVIPADGSVSNVKLAPNAVTTDKILDGTIINADISTSASVAVSKLAHVGSGNVLKSNGAANIGGQVVNADIDAAAGIAVTKLAHVGANNILRSDGTANVGGQLVNADVSSSAAIALSKLAPGSSGILRSDGTVITAGNLILAADISPDTITSSQLAADSVGTSELANNAVVNANVDPAAAIAVSKLAHVGAGNVLKSNGAANVGGQVVNADVDPSAAIALTKLAHVGAGNVLKSTGTANVGGQVVNADVASSAAITVSKLAAGGTANRVVATTDGTTMTMAQVTSAMIADGTIVNADIADGTIDVAKLNFDPSGGSGTIPADGSVTNAKLAPNAVTTDKIADGTILNQDIDAAAGIVLTKIAHVGAGNVLRSNGTTNVAGQVQAGDLAPGVAFGNPMTTVADIIVGGTAGAPTRMAKGTALQYLRVNAGNTALEYGALPVDPGFANPMTTSQDLIIGGASGAPARMVKGANSTYLRVSTGGLLEYGALPVDPGFANPMTTSQDLIIGGASGTPTRMAKGANGTVLGIDGSGNLAYTTTLTNPMTTPNDVIIGGTAGAATRLAAGANGTYLRTNAGTGALEYGTLPVDPGFANPMTTSQDLIIGGASGTPARLAKGANGTVLGIDGSGNLAYSTPLTNPMTTPNDIIIGGASGAATRLAKGANSTYLRVSTGGALEYGALPVDPGFANPMTGTNDLIAGGASGTPTRLAPGANGTYLRTNASTGALEYGALPVDPGFANPMTTTQDIIVGGASGVPTRMVKGANSTYLRVSSGGVLEYGTLPVDPGFANPMTTAGDIITGGVSGAPSRTAKGANSTVLGVDSGGTLGYTTVTSAMIADQAIMDADVNNSAAINIAKLAHVGTGNILRSNGTVNVAGQVATGDITVGAIAEIRLAYTAASSLFAGTAIAASTELQFVANQNFTVTSTSSVIGIFTSGGGQVTQNTPELVTSRAYIDWVSAGTPGTVYYLGGQRVMVANEFANPFTGHGGTFITGLSAGVHTIRFALFTGAAGLVYMRASTFETFGYDVVEWKR